MPDDVVLIAEPRSERGSGPAGRLRRAGRLPAVVYGLGGEATAITVPAHDVDLLLARGANTLITLRLDGRDQLTLARQVQRHPVRGDLLHVDFVRVSVDVAIAADVPLHLVGEPEGVKSGGLLEQQLFTLPVEAKPQDIPAAIEVDVTHLGLGDQLRLSEIALPAGVTISLDPDTLVAAIAVPRGLAAAAASEGAEGEAAPEESAATPTAAEVAEGAESDEE
jgi:large subunit ribosomal protein L25